ncbi:L-idonate 5-dehydrogenase [Bradyrhizobium sp. SSBR45G]|uniref:L-idonate 5-dehydrogenase n=1 Tax=unclassified Bradyrhizobium TaxID=2631580 RepID=UPI0023429006|nr:MULTISPECIES: L-idonate 5-dehydrogenase [unclassified Bradyrhizobium]GLH81212.1 L-idonate 5-dehydrogenase [Bradyrhizobium sp. SSBR45G]GLH88613.1 L-idonate 5-dehydrogenase [Bradyrhizobium sp. SSBR45R]
MRAVVIHAPKDLRIDSFPDPAPGAGEVRVKIEAGGICGSDLHYYHHGGFGTVRIKQPMALGHEIAGVVAAVGVGVTGLSEGTRVAVNPSLPCGTCAYCREGLRNQCLDMRFMGSAMRDPHVQGGFREFVTVDASQAVPIAPSLSTGEAAMAEPLSVCLHAAHQAGSLLGKRVLVTGCGPIGALSILVARYGGAAEIVATDVADAPLAVARKLGASHALNVGAEPSALDPWRAGKGTFDVLFEASGNQAALRAALDVMRPGGVIVQLGLGGEMTLPVNTLVTKELQLRGTFRFDREFELAVRLMGEGLLDVKPLITATLPFQEAISAFELASDRSRAMKVHLTF